MVEKALAQMREIPVRMSGGGHSLIHLHDVNRRPWNILVGKLTQHYPGRVTAADSDYESAPRSHGFPCFFSDNAGSPFGHGFRGVQHFHVDRLYHAARTSLTPAGV